jgi:hypothetical protein
VRVADFNRITLLGRGKVGVEPFAGRCRGPDRLPKLVDWFFDYLTDVKPPDNPGASSLIEINSIEIRQRDDLS